MSTPDNNGTRPGLSANPPGPPPAGRPDTPDAAVPGAAGAEPAAWRRPAPMARETNVRAWLIFLAVLCLAVALWTPLRAFYYRQRYSPSADPRTADATCFVALAYSGVADDVLPGSMDITPAAFEQQLKILRARGYTPIGLDDVLAFYKEGKLLPRKAVLTTFEQSRKTSYFEVRHLLRAYHWRAVMGVCTSPMHARDDQALRWPYLRDMLAMGPWELAAQSQHGFHYVPAFSDGSSGPFFSTPKWLDEAGRHEYPSEFRARIGKDHDDLLAEFQRETRQKPLAFFFPYGDYGQFDERAKFVRLSNLYQVGEKYELGFTLGALALNTRLTDRRRLNRLLVDPRWTAEDLADRLDAFWPMEVDGDQRLHVFRNESVICEWGRAELADQGFSLQAVPPQDPLQEELRDKLKRTATTGARVWMAGSDTFMDGHLAVRFHLQRGTFGLYLRAVPGHEHLYILFDENGRVGVRQKLPDLDEATLAAEDTAVMRGGNHEILVTLKGKLLYVRLNGKTLFGGRVLLREKPRPGLLGMGVWDSVPGLAATHVLDARIMPRREAVVTWTPHTALDIGYLTEWLHMHSYRFSILSPPWIDIFESAPQKFPTWDQAALDLLARSNEVRIFPGIQIRQSPALMRASTDDILEDLAGLKGVAGVYVDASAVKTTEVNELVGWLLRLQKGLDRMKFRLALRLPVAIETLPSAGNLFKLFPDALLVGDYKSPPFGLTPDRVYGMDSVSPPAGEETLALYYQISNLSSEFEDISPEAVNHAIRQRGFDAFAANDFQGAIDAWTEWMERDPHNGEPPGLIGDAHLRLNAHEKALEFYTRSLELDPGNMNLAMRRSRLLETMQRLDESVEALNVYSRTFPDSPTIIVAQANWLNRNGQRSKARGLMRDLVRRFPDEIEARLLLQTLLDHPQERYANMQELLNMCEANETKHFGFGKEMGAVELLTIPEASLFFDFIRRTARTSPNKLTRDLYHEFLPLTNSVVEDFSSGKLSDNWFYLGGLRPMDQGRYELRASSDLSEAFLRLKKSELMRDGFIEVALDESIGYFWIYARRSSRSMIRFGFDNEGFVHIQSWLNGNLLSFENRPWMRPPGMVTLRLNVRGDGAMGYINGHPAFTTPLVISSDVAYGWWSIAPFSPDYGTARARLSSIHCGPLAPVMVMLPTLDDARMNQALDWVRPRVRHISALAPVAFVQNPDGSVSQDPQTAFSLVRMFATYHRLRLMPVLEMAYYSDIEPAKIVDLINLHRLDGLVLRLRILPDEPWFKALAREMERTTADLIVIRNERTFWPVPGTPAAKLPRDGERRRLRRLAPSHVREISRGSLLLPPLAPSWSVRAQPYQDWMTVTNGIDTVGTALQLYVVPGTIIGADVDETVAAARQALQEETLAEALRGLLSDAERTRQRETLAQAEREALELSQRAAIQAAFEEVQERLRQEARASAQPAALQAALRTTLEENRDPVPPAGEDAVPAGGRRLSPREESLKNALQATMNEILGALRTPEEQRQMLHTAWRAMIEEEAAEPEPRLPRRIELPGAAPPAPSEPAQEPEPAASTTEAAPTVVPAAESTPAATSPDAAVPVAAATPAEAAKPASATKPADAAKSASSTKPAGAAKPGAPVGGGEGR